MAGHKQFSMAPKHGGLFLRFGPAPASVAAMNNTNGLLRHTSQRHRTLKSLRSRKDSNTSPSKINGPQNTRTGHPRPRLRDLLGPINQAVLRRPLENAQACGTLRSSPPPIGDLSAND